MEEIIDVIFSFDVEDSRQLYEKGTVPVFPKWKEALWDSNSVEPAMLRVPIVIIVFVALWGLNIFIFEKIRLQYQNVLSIKSGILFYVLEHQYE